MKTRLAKIMCLYTFYFALCFVFYKKAASASLSYDLLDFLISYKQKGLAGFKCNFNDASVRPFFHINHLIILFLFDLNYNGWNFVSVSLHAFNSLLVFLFCRQVLRLNGSDKPSIISFFAGLIFLLSPYQNETVVWGCTIHYLTTVACILIALLACLKFFTDGSKAYLIVIKICFLTGIFSLEYTLMLPFMLLALLYFFYRYTDWKKRRLFWLTLFIPQILFFPFYFLLNKIILGKFIGHYGASVHLNFTSATIVFNLQRYLLNYCVFAEYLPFGLNNKIFSFLHFNASAILPFFAAILILLLWVGRKQPFFLFMFLLFLLSLVPGINLYILMLFQKQSDRLGYLALVFFSIALSYSAFTFFNPKVASILLMIYIITGAWFLEQNLLDWQHAGNISNGLVEDFIKRFKNHKVCVLAEAENYNGAYIFTPNFTGQSCNYDLDKRIFLATGKTVTPHIIHVVGFEMKKETDSVILQRSGVDSFAVSMSKPGIRLLHNYFPLTAYEDSDCKLIPEMKGSKCLVILKQNAENATIIYQSGKKWKIIN